MPGSETTESGLAGANEPNLGNFMVSKRQGYGLSHNADLAPAVQYIQKKTDKQIVQAYFRSHGDVLRNACWDHIFFDDLMPKLATVLPVAIPTTVPPKAP